MANYYSAATAEISVPASPKEYERLKLLLTLQDPDDPSVTPNHGFTLLHGQSGAFLCSGQSESVDADELPKAFLEAFGALLKANGIPHLEVGVAETCDKMRAGSHSGYRFRITDTGKLVYPTLTWP